LIEYTFDIPTVTKPLIYSDNLDQRKELFGNVGFVKKNAVFIGFILDFFEI
jgi:hypothetical protein